MRMKNYYIGIVLLFLGFISCKKDTPTISTTPELTFTSISPGSVKQYSESVTIAITYKDGDGDIGENNTDKKNLFVTDSRNGVTYQYRVNQLAPDGATIAITGTLTIVVANTALTNINSASESVNYSIYLVDRAGHSSNVISTSAITVTN